MHEELEPECAQCLHFVLAFNTESPLADWGYCLLRTRGVELAPEELRQVEEETGQGNTRRAAAAELGLFEPLGHACERFVPYHPF